MRRSILAGFLFLLLATTAHAQLPTRGDAYIGYSYLRTPSIGSSLFGAPIVQAANLNGWNGSVEFKLLPWIGGVADFGGNYGTQTVGPICPPPPIAAPCIAPVNVGVSDHTFLFGPRASVSLGKFKPFVHGLLGGAHTKATVLGVSATNTVFSTAIGGGLDTRIVKGFAWRLQADDVRLAFSGGAQHNFRFSTGLVLHF